MSDVVLTVRSELLKLLEELEKIEKKSKTVGEELSKGAQAASDGLSDQTKKTSTFLSKMGDHGRRVANQLLGDFKTLASMNALADAFKISSQFRGSIKETVDLSDNIRKLGRVFGVAQKDFSSFHSALTKGLGEIGLSSDVASRAMEGLSAAGTGVSGQQAVVGYGRAAGQLGSVTKSQGREGDIAKLMSQVIQSKGGDVNSLKEIGAVAEDVRRVFNATGAGAADTLTAMKQIFTGMATDMREKISTRGLANLAAAGTVAGPQSTKFIEEFMAKSKIDRLAMEAQGFKGVFTDKGMDVDKFGKASKEILGRIGMDPRKSAQTLGISEEAAEGFVRLSQNLEQLKKVQDGVNQSTSDLSTQYQESMGLGESFKANINRVKRVFAEPLSVATQGATSMLSRASQSDLGSAGVVAGGATLAAMLAGFGMKGIGGGLMKGMAGTAARGAAAEGITGQKTIPVYVTNAGEMGGAMAGAAGTAMSKLGLLGKGLGAAGAAFGGYEAGKMIEPGVTGLLNQHTAGRTSEGFEGNALERLFFKLEAVLGTGEASRFEQRQKVVVELNNRDLKESKQPTRGASN